MSIHKDYVANNMSPVNDVFRRGAGSDLDRKDLRQVD